MQILGTPGKAGASLNPLQFDQPAEIFVHTSGEIFIVDGDGGMNNRLIKLSKGMYDLFNVIITDDEYNVDLTLYVSTDLQVVWVHGEKGQELAQFYIPHSVAVDSYQRVSLKKDAINTSSVVISFK